MARIHGVTCRSCPQKKLIEAARHWAAATKPAEKPDAEKLRKSLRRQGLPEETVEQLVQREIGSGAAQGEPGYFEVWPENWAHLELFLACRTQWQWVAGFAGATRVGFRYEGVEIVIRHRVKPKDRDEAFAALQLMEAEALVAMSSAEE